jgi:MFS transporter, MHS family, shikimate and dehydroshikimate transport protein
MQAISQGKAGMSIGKIALASAIGTTIEWYDFFLYGVVTPIVLNKLFFPNFDPIAGTLLAYATFFVGFLSARSAASSSVIMATASGARPCWCSRY